MNPRHITTLVSVAALLVGACSGGTAQTTTVTSRPAPAPTTTVAPDPAVDGPIFRVGLTSDLTTANWWAAMDSEATPENQAILANTKESLFTLTKPGFVLVPALAASPEPRPVSQQGSVWVVEQPLRDDVFWSDDTQVTAEDLAFYFDVVREFALGSAHAALFPESITDVSAVDDLTVRVEFSAMPSLRDWQTGVAMAPLVPSHFWEPHIDAAREAARSALAGTSDEEAKAAVAAASLADADQNNDLKPGQVSDEALESYKSEVAAKAGRDHLYSVESPEEPSSGSLIFEKWTPGEYAVTRANPGYFGRGTETTIYSDGSVRLAGPVVGDEVYDGQASGGVIAHHVVGPFVSAVEWHELGSEAEAYAALQAGVVDFVFDPDGMTFPMYNELAGEDATGLSISEADGFRFLAFNLRKPPMSDPVFRHAVATLIDKELLASTLFNGTLSPAYTLVHPGLATFHNADVDRPGWSNGDPMGEAQRYEAAIAMLTEAGYTWDEEPEVVYDADGDFVDVVPGAGLEMPNGIDVPDLRVLAAPGSGDDPMRATFALWIEQWMTDLGMEVTTETTDFDSIVDTAVRPDSSEAVLSWDLHVLGWGRPNLALPGLTLMALFHSRNRAEAGGLNATGYASAAFDAAADAFVASATIEEAAMWTHEMERILAEDLPYVTLYRAPIIEAFRSDIVFPVESVMGGHAIANGWPESVRITG